VGRRKPLNLGGKWEILCRKNREREGGRGGEVGWERLKSKPFPRRFSAGEPLPLGESSWLALCCSPDAAGEPLSSHQTWPSAVLSYTHCLGPHLLPHHGLHS